MITQAAPQHAARRAHIPASFPAGPLLRKIGELDDEELCPDSAFPLRDARLVFADHALLQHDFPQLADALLRQSGVAGPDCNDFRERWLMRHAALMSVRQV